jgi:hypothetical protein
MRVRTPPRALSFGRRNMRFLGLPEKSVRGFDVTCSTPKWASVLFAIGDDHTHGEVLAAHNVAVTAVAGWIESHAYTLGSAWHRENDGARNERDRQAHADITKADRQIDQLRERLAVAKDSARRASATRQATHRYCRPTRPRPPSTHPGRRPRTTSNRRERHRRTTNPRPVRPHHDARALPALPPVFRFGLHRVWRCSRRVQPRQTRACSG